MSGLYKNYKTDEKKELEGVRIEYPANDDGTIPVFIISRQTSNNVRWMKAYENETRPYRRLMDGKKLEPATARKINMRIFAKSLMMGWEHIQDVNGKELEFNFENIMQVFTDLHDVFEELNQHTQEATLYREDAVAVETKN